MVFFGVLVTAKMRPSKDKREPISDMPESTRPSQGDSAPAAPAHPLSRRSGPKHPENGAGT
jgi:hypothetical protein